jgi:hypothetical protein
MKNSHPSLIVCGDIHCARSWNRIAEIFKGHISYLNPNQQLENLIDIVNDDPDVISLIANGDLVDYYFSERISRKSGMERKTNWEFYYDLMSKLNVKCEENVGNHDYRKEPYSYKIYGLSHVNVPGKVRLEYSSVIDHNDFRGLSEFSSIVVDVQKFDPLQKYRGNFFPTKKTIGPYQCIFLNSGSDAFVNLKNIPRYFKKTLLARWFCVDSEGFNRQDIRFVNNVLNKNFEDDLYFFTHAPLINSRKQHLGKRYQISLNKFLENNAKRGLAHKVVLNGGGEMLGVMVESEQKNIIIIASHVHNAKYYLIEKASLIATQVSIEELNSEKGNPHYIKHLTTLPLGYVHPGDGNCLGFLKITPDGFEEVVLNRV